MGHDPGTYEQGCYIIYCQCIIMSSNLCCVTVTIMCFTTKLGPEYTQPHCINTTMSTKLILDITCPLELTVDFVIILSFSLFCRSRSRGILR